MEIIHETSKTKLLKNIREDLLETISLSIENGVLLMLSGGSAIEILDELEVNSFDNRVTITTLDERFSTKPEDSNFLAITKTEFYRKCKQNGCNFIDTNVTAYDELQNFAKFWEKQLQNWHVRHPYGKVIIVQGIGDDGHTAGILPMHKDSNTFKSMFQDTSKWVVGYRYSHVTKYPERVTVTLNFLLSKVDYSFVWSIDDEILTDLAEKNSSYYIKPAKVIFDMEGVRLYTNIKFEYKEKNILEKIENGFNINRSRKISI